MIGRARHPPKDPYPFLIQCTGCGCAVMCHCGHCPITEHIFLQATSTPAPSPTVSPPLSSGVAAFCQVHAMSSAPVDRNISLHMVDDHAVVESGACGAAVMHQRQEHPEHREHQEPPLRLINQQEGTKLSEKNEKKKLSPQLDHVVDLDALPSLSAQGPGETVGLVQPAMDVQFISTTLVQPQCESEQTAATKGDTDADVSIVIGAQSVQRFGEHGRRGSRPIDVDLDDDVSRPVLCSCCAQVLSETSASQAAATASEPAILSNGADAGSGSGTGCPMGPESAGTASGIGTFDGAVVAAAAVKSTASARRRSKSRSTLRDVLIVSRCKHLLCATCAVRAVADTYAPPAESAVIDLIDVDAEEYCAAARPQVSALKSIATCPVLRCKAPLSSEEAHAALAPLTVDDMFTASLDNFDAWVDAGGPMVRTGVNVSLPPFSKEMGARALRVEGGDELGEWFNDDFQSAYAPFWVCEPLGTSSGPQKDSIHSWIGDFLVENLAEPTNNLAEVIDKLADPTDNQEVDVRWICAVCGFPEAIDDAERMNHRPLCDGPPQYLHCAYARAYGTVSAVRSLLSASEIAGKKPGAEKCTVNLRPRGKKRPAAYVSGMLSKRHKKSSTGFAKGTGYGGCAEQKNDWSGLSKQLLEKTVRADAEAAYWLSRIRCYIVLGSNNVGARFASSWPVFMRPLLRKCCLTTVVAKLLVNDSIMDVGERVPVYVSALRVVNALTDAPSLRMLVTEPIEAAGGRCIASLVDSLSRQAALLTAGAGADNLDAKSSLLIRQIRRAIRGVNRHCLLHGHEPNIDIAVGVSSALRSKQSMTQRKSGDGVDCSNRCELEESKKNVLRSESDNCISHADDFETAVTDSEKSSYVTTMRNLMFDTVPGLAKTSSFYAEAMQGSLTTVGKGSSMRRIASEVASLFSSLPLDWSSAIVVRVDEDRYDFLRAAIFGPEGTPYDSGVFIFDIFLPPTYPETPPKLRLLTTGGGRVRFNPNLYACGKVCLSLLGTWFGPTWTRASTLLQVLVSIQSLILVEHPYFNEPYYEPSFGTDHGKLASEHYNKDVRRNNIIYAMLYNIRNAPADLRDVILLHFRLKRRAVRKLVNLWFPDSLAPHPNSTAGAAGTTVPGHVPPQPHEAGPEQGSSALNSAVEGLHALSNAPASGNAFNGNLYGPPTSVLHQAMAQLTNTVNDFNTLIATHQPGSALAGSTTTITPVSAPQLQIGVEISSLMKELDNL
jgi:ubiquitin-protein ligase